MIANSDKENQLRNNKSHVVRAKGGGRGRKHSSRGVTSTQYQSLYGPTILKPRRAHVKKEGGDGGIEREGEMVKDGLNTKKLVSILKAYGEYPAKYRVFIWRSILQLPGNHTAYSSLLERGTHTAYTNLHRDYPIRSQRLSRVLQR